jgi:hypothetical protein
MHFLYGGSLTVTAEALAAAAAWVTPGQDMDVVTLDVRRHGDLDVLRVQQGDDAAEFRSDGTSAGHVTVVRVRPDIDRQVQAVLNVLAPFVDGPPGFAPQRWPVFRFDYEGIMVMPSVEQVTAVAQAVVTAIRTAAGPPPVSAPASVTGHDHDHKHGGLRYGIPGFRHSHRHDHSGGPETGLHGSHDHDHDTQEEGGVNRHG